MANVISKDLTTFDQFLLNQYSNSTNVNKLLNIFLAKVQELDDANLDLDKFSTDIALSFGYQLDLIGKLVNAPRDGRDDTTYRIFIRFTIAINSGSGTPEDIFTFLKFVTTATDIKYFEHYPASLYLYLDGVTTPDTSLPQSINDMMIAGSSLGYIGYGNNPLVFTPFDTSYAEQNLLLDNGQNLELSNANNLTVNVATTSPMLENSYLAEFEEAQVFTLVDNINDTIVDNVIDTIGVVNMAPAPDLGRGILAETM